MVAGSGPRSLLAIATGDTASTAMGGRITAPSVRAAAGALVNRAVGGTDPVCVGWTTGSVGGYGSLTGNEVEFTTSNASAKLMVGVGNASVVGDAVLTAETPGGGGSKFASWLDEVEADIGQGGTREGGEGQEAPHVDYLGWMRDVQYWVVLDCIGFVVG